MNEHAAGKFLLQLLWTIHLLKCVLNVSQKSFEIMLKAWKHQDVYLFTRFITFFFIYYATKSPHSTQFTIGQSIIIVTLHMFLEGIFFNASFKKSI